MSYRSPPTSSLCYMIVISVALGVVLIHKPNVNNKTLTTGHRTTAWVGVIGFKSSTNIVNLLYHGRGRAGGAASVTVYGRYDGNLGSGSSLNGEYEKHSASSPLLSQWGISVMPT